MKHAEIITAKGTAAIAEKVGVPPAHVRVWKLRGIPRSRFADVLAAFPDVTLDALKQGAPARRAA
jgi:hypothetical protein